MSSVAYWYAEKPSPAVAVPPLEKRLPVLRNNAGAWIDVPARAYPGRPVTLTEEMQGLKEKAAQK
jgi:hypothetical protein